jgi:hypothetical protein
MIQTDFSPSEIDYHDQTTMCHAQLVSLRILSNIEDAASDDRIGLLDQIQKTRIMKYEQQ